MSAPDALVIGEALTDIVLAADGTESSRPGGSPANVAVGLARLDVRTELVTSLGADTAGEGLRTHLEGAGVDLRPAAAVPPERTSSARAILDPQGAAVYSFDLAWEPGAIAPGPVRLLHTGSLAMVVEPGASQVLAALTAAEPGTVISIDPNVRPHLGVPREHVRRQLERFAGHAHLVKLSDEDLSWTYPGASYREVAERLHGHGAQLVVVTRGAQGCLLFAPRWHSELTAPTATLVDTIGAGDSFMSGLLRALLASGHDEALCTGTVSRHQAEAWAGIAMRCAALTVGRVGAQPPRTEELEAQSDTISSVPASTSPEARSTIVV